MRAPRSRPYKEITYQQLRSFCEMARLGSFTAAADSLGLTDPTVGTQVHILEQELGEKLVERAGRQCRLTKAGHLLLELVVPPVISIATLKHAFREACAQIPTHLVVGSMPRIVIEDLPECVEAFSRQQPNVDLILRELRQEEIRRLLEAGEIDLAFAVNTALPPSIPGRSDPRLEWEICYEQDVYLVTPRSHPLARKRRLDLRQLCAYPVISSPETIHDRAVSTLMEEYGLFRGKRCRVTVRSAAAIRAYVQQGLGIGLICCPPPRTPNPLVHERSLSRLFGRSPIYALWRKGGLTPAARALVALVKARLGRRAKHRAEAAREHF